MLKISLFTLVVSFLILFYQLIIYPCFHNDIASMLKRIRVGLVSLLFTTTYFVIKVASKDHFLLTQPHKKLILYLNI